MGRKENVLRAQYSLLQLGTQYTHTHGIGVGPVQIRCRTNLVESDQDKNGNCVLMQIYALRAQSFTYFFDGRSLSRHKHSFFILQVPY